MPAAAFAAEEAWFASPAEWVRRVRATCAGAGAPEAAEAALRANARVSDGCRLELALGTPIFPRAPLPEGETRPGYLLRQCRAGVERRYAAERRRGAEARLREELGLIERLGFTDYFLLVADIVGFARRAGIPTVGRGSGAGSIVAYCLGITNVDPLRYGLYFERFLHPARRDCPDLDIDVCWRRRDDLIAHVYRTYGAEQVAMICTQATLGARSAFRETAKVLGVPSARVDALARHVPRELAKPYRQQLTRYPAARRVDWSEPPLADALRLAESLDGAPHHLSIHPGGLVIADRPLTHYAPLEEAAKGIVVTQYEMRAIEAIGLVKMDLLGNRALTTIGDCVELVRERQGVSVEVEGLPDPDPGAVALLERGDTLNCFQLESPAMRNLLRMLRAGSLDATIAAVALVRPGPAESGMKEIYCRRARGLEPVRHLHPRLERVLDGTYGVMLYEEDVMCVAAALLGLSFAEGDLLRRAIAEARTEDELRALERGFVGQAARAGVDEPCARAVWAQLAQFAAYAFCKAHAAGYGALAYQSAYLKAHFPTEYAVAVLDNHAGMYPTWVHVENLRRRGVRFLAPCVNASARGARLEATREVRVGLDRVVGLSQAAAERILTGRPFADLADLATRARPALPEMENLVLAGALDFTGRSRPALLLEARAGAAAFAHAAHVAARGGAVLDGVPAPRTPVPVPELPEFPPAERVRGEIAATGLWFSAHPLEVFVPPAAHAGLVQARELPDHVGRRVRVLGLPCASRRVETHAGAQMLFLTLADRSGLAECVLFPDAYRRCAPATRGSVVGVEGRVEETLGAVTVSAEQVVAVAS
jgi:DNA-directed DNA polymerase III PolC